MGLESRTITRPPCPLCLCIELQAFPTAGQPSLEFPDFHTGYCPAYHSISEDLAAPGPCISSKLLVALFLVMSTACASPRLQGWPPAVPATAQSPWRAHTQSLLLPKVPDTHNTVFVGNELHGACGHAPASLYTPCSFLI